MQVRKLQRPLSEWPVHAVEGTQVIAGRIDLLIEIPNGFVVMDHKSFPGVIDVEGERLRAFAGQAAFYAHSRGSLAARAGNFGYISQSQPS